MSQQLYAQDPRGSNVLSEPTHVEVLWGTRILDDGFTSIPNFPHPKLSRDWNRTRGVGVHLHVAFLQARYPRPVSRTGNSRNESRCVCAAGAQMDRLAGRQGTDSNWSAPTHQKQAVRHLGI